MQEGSQNGAERRIAGYCALCKSRCGCISVVRDGRLIAVEPDPSHPTGRKLCAKGLAAPEIVHNPKRLLYPMRRTRPKGYADPGWQRIGWDEALDRTVAGLQEIAASDGPEAVAFGVTTPSGTALSDSISWVERLIRCFGSPNTIYSTEICNWHKDHATAFTFGSANPVPDFANAGCILLWGHNPSTAWLSHAVEALDGRGRGARLVVVDPRRVGLANKADQWLRVRPGSDGALALGLANVMIQDELFDRDFMTRWSNGPFLVHPETGRFVTEADLQAHGDPPADSGALVAWCLQGNHLVPFDPTRGVFRAPCNEPALFGAFELQTESGSLTCQPAFQHYADLAAQYDPACVESVTGVSAAQVVETARLIGRHRPLAYYAWSGVGQHSNATQTDRAIALLAALTGSYDVPGGNVAFAKVPVNDVSGQHLISDAQRAKTLGLDQRPLGPGRGGWITGQDFCRAVEQGEPYSVRGLFGFGSNLMASQPDAAGTARALAKLQFHVHADLVMNPTAAFADIVLPVCSPWEREALRAGFGVSQEAESLLQLRAPAMAPLGESRADTWIVFELAKRLGFGNRFFGGEIDAGLRHELAPSGVSLETLRAEPRGLRLPLKTRYRKYAERDGEGARGFATPSRRVEVYAEQLLEISQEPLPTYVEPAASPLSRPDLAKHYPLVLTSAKVTSFCHSQFRGVAALRRKAPDPLLEIHPDTAAARGIIEGDWLRIETPIGTLRARAKLNAQLSADVVCGQHGWWEGVEELDLPEAPMFGPGSTNYNAVIDNEARDPISGSVSLKSYLCQVSREVEPDEVGAPAVEVSLA